jgi:ribosome maturation factor RimP
VGSEPTFYLQQISRGNRLGFPGFRALKSRQTPGSETLVKTGGSGKKIAGPAANKKPSNNGLGTMAVTLDAIREAAERVASSHGLAVVDVEFTGSVKERVLRVFLEKNAAGRAQLKAAIAAGAEGLPERLAEGSLNVEQISGVTHEDCAVFSRDFSVLLDVEDLVAGASYTLEASSPGLDRKLSQPGDFERFLGCLVKVRTLEPVRNNRHWQGRLIVGTGSPSVTGTITLDLTAARQDRKSRRAGAGTVEIALGNIERAQIVPEI